MIENQSISPWHIITKLHSWKKKSQNPSFSKKHMVSILGDTDGIIQMDFLGSGTAINWERYFETFRTLHQSLSRVWKQKKEILMQGAKPHTSWTSHEAIVSLDLTILCHLSYSFKSVSWGFHLFPKLKECLHRICWLKWRSRDKVESSFVMALRNMPIIGRNV